MTSSGRVALITGCGKPKGIGAATARALAAAGITVVVSDIEKKGVPNIEDLPTDIDQSWRGWRRTSRRSPRRAALLRGSRAT